MYNNFYSALKSCRARSNKIFNNPLGDIYYWESNETTWLHYFLTFLNILVLLLTPVQILHMVWKYYLREVREISFLTLLMPS